MFAICPSCNVICSRLKNIYALRKLMNTPSSPSSPVDAARELLKQIRASFPVFRDNKPLAIGIDKQIHAQMQGVEKKVLRIALGLHTNTTQYLKSVEKAGARFNLDGSLAGEVEESHRVHASETLSARFKKSLQQKKAQREAEKAERQHAEKLQKLAEKFSQRR